ncbi:Pyridine nucleotide-disulfide oxidoreductase [uncultured Eubacteriales bacterium]|uniref:Pyridine nucleotide-disulfide oxidoreductase n=1 Tax=uncultured Eubacteriales bacterium TaxID=172733 RepID=A0A212K1V2_9FIRM|nr:Pyridine nucleotide-disulfide oxidoreductase [uncultured Eubacteriales bacterium]
MYDIAVIGGGPAGLSAAVQARQRGKTALVISGADADGPLWKTERVDNYLGMPQVTGAGLGEQFRTHAEAMGVERMKGRALNIMPSGGKFYISVGSDMVEAQAVVLAPGVARGAKYPGEAEHLGRGVSYCATCDGMLYRGKNVVVVGKSAEAPEEANFLREIGCQVTYVSAKEPEGLREDVPFVKAPKVEVLGDETVTGLKAGGEVFPCEGVFILRAAVAPTDLLPGLELKDGYISVDRDMATSVPGVFAAGDCTGLPLQISKAVGEGQIAGHRAAELIDKKKSN